ncbi:hypothetical protein RSP673_001750 [Ralstonia solanacearum P673]|uniref:hypothetical protein n=1 Tax=Ralstonia solanacearum TaxID=305 RepID=UPI00202A26CB|nr:hypothetical protein [Ralstonia solanacearum]MCL9847602.1 hypothetical protein [Ralstonia solanacearum]MCL9853640.1 hypothetical protein [Ralstonia solanacearum]MCL9861466.1 hypothetical protein [Ralstonia solanacearum]MCL9863642.1 hypothetical protein [Ralstonia solanacearum]MCL9868086.1 hypothetical protein [Ralstonia solanacearum]
MKTPLLPAVSIEALAPLSEQNFSDVLLLLNSNGTVCTFKQRQPAAYASLDWVIPTGIVVFITHSYFDGIFKEIGKEHYQRFKEAVSSLYKKALGDHPEIEFSIASAGKMKAPSHFRGSLSFVYSSRRGYTVKLLFPLDITTTDYAVSCEEFLKLITAHEAKHADDPLGMEIELRAKERAALSGNRFSAEHTLSTISLLVFWNRNDQCFHVADAVASSRSKALVSKRIGCE